MILCSITSHHCCPCHSLSSSTIRLNAGPTVFKTSGEVIERPCCLKASIDACFTTDKANSVLKMAPSRNREWFVFLNNPDGPRPPVAVTPFVIVTTKFSSKSGYTDDKSSNVKGDGISTFSTYSDASRKLLSASSTTLVFCLQIQGLFGQSIRLSTNTVASKVTYLARPIECYA